MAQQILNTPRETTHQRIADALEDIVDKIVDTSSADNIDYDNTTSGLSANKVQSAIDELALAGFVTNTVNNLVNYYLKSETYNKTEVDSLINAVKNSRFEVVSTLPTTNIKTNVIYLVPKSPTQTSNAKDEYINLDGTSSGWEKIGDTEVDLSGYVTTTALNNALSNYTTTTNLTNLLDSKVDKVSGKGLSTNDYTDEEKNKLSGIEAGAQVNEVTSVAGKTGAVTLDKSDVRLGNVDNTSDANKPISTATQTALNGKVNTSDVGTASAKDYTTSVTQNSNDLVTSGAVWTAIDNLPEPLIFKGTLGAQAQNPTITSLPTASSSNEGWVYQVITAGTYNSQVCKVGDKFACATLDNGTTYQWVYMPIGDSDTNTWRAINVNGAQVIGNGISSGNVNFKSGTNAGFSASRNDITVDVDTTFTDASSRVNIASGDSIKTILSKIKKWFTDLKTVAFTGKTSDLTNDSGFINTVDSAMSDSSTNPLQNKVITKELEGAKTTTGNPITVTDVTPVNAVNLSMDLEPIQDLHGYDHPWVGGAGKNLLPMTVEGIKAVNTAGTWNGNVYTVSGVTFTILTDDDGNVTNIKVQGTPTSRAQLSLVNGYILNTFKGMILNGANKDYSGNNGIYVGYSNDGSYWVSEGFQKKGDVTIQNYNYVHFDIMCDYGTFDDDFKPMIRLATDTDSTFAPYTNICPISGRSEVAIQRVGVNQWDEEWELGSIDGTTGEPVSNSNIIRSKNFNRCDGGKTYYCKAFGGATIHIYYYDAFKNYISKQDRFENNTVTTPLNTAYFKIIIFGSTYNNNVSVNYPSTDHDYHAYAGKTYTIQIGQTVYGCHYDVTRGKMMVDKGYADLSQLSWTLSARNRWQTTDLSALITSVDNSQPFVAVSDRFRVYSANDLWNEQTLIGMAEDSSSYNYLLIRNGSTIDTPTGQLVYELATPFTIDLTPQQIKMLENTNTLSSDGTLTLEYQPNNAIGEAVRAVEESYDPEFAVRPVLKKKAFSGTTDSDGSVTLINASDIPSGHKIIPLHITDMTIGGSAGTYFVEYEPYNSGDAVKGYCYTYFNGSQITPVGSAVTGNFYYYELEG